MTQRLAPGKLHSIQQDCPHIDNPLAFYRHMYQASGNSLLLESVEGGEVLGRYSAIGLDPDVIWTYQKNVVTVNNKIQDVDPLQSLPNQECR